MAAFDRLQIGSELINDSHPPLSLRRKFVRNYLKKYLSHVHDDEIWEPVLAGGEDISLSSDPLWTVGQKICEEHFRELSELLAPIASALQSSSELPGLIGAIEEYIDNFAPPSAVLPVSGGSSDANFFWLLMYAAWHYRLNEPRFMKFAVENGWKDDPGAAEEALGNLVLHGLQSLEIKSRWKEYSRNGASHGD